MTISKKLLALSGTGLFFVVAIGLAGYLGSRNIGEGMADVTLTATALQDHMEADMMHDAIRADVLAALLAEDENAREEVRKSLEDHAKTFELAVKRCEEMELSQEIKKALESVRPALAAYIEQGKKHVELAFADKAAAKTKLGEFTQVFETLEEKMATLSEGIEKGMNDARAEQSNAVQAFRMTLLYLLLGAMAATAAISWVIVRGITGSLMALVAVVEDISEGEGDLTARITISSNDEIGRLASGFNVFLTKIHAIVKEISENAAHLSSESKNIAAISGSISTSTNEMILKSTTSSTATEQANTNIRNVAAAIEEISASSNLVATESLNVNRNLDGVGVTVEEVSTRMTSVAAAVEEMSSSLSAIAGSARDLFASLSNVSNNTVDANKFAENASVKARATAETINRLGSSAKEIDKVVDLITGIAEQTNLLALNASIEAASAGDAGKGFAVVANEVKELAKQTARATQDIRMQVEGIQGNTAASVSAISEIVEVIARVCEVFGNINQSVQVQTAGLNEISQSVNDAAKGSAEISANVQGAAANASEVSGSVAESIKSLNSITSNIAELAEGANEIARNAAEASIGMNDVAALVLSVNNVADTTRVRVGDLDHSANELAERAARLHTLVGSFSI